MRSLQLKPRLERRVRRGHPWVFSNEIQAWGKPPPEAGEIVEIKDSKGRFVGRGFCNPSSLISVRLLTRLKREAVDEHLVRERIRAAIAARESILGPSTTAIRLVFGEGDGLPGLVVDRYDRVLAVQFLTQGIERFRAQVLEELSRLDPVAIVERNDNRGRALEGLPAGKAVLSGSLPERVEILQDGLRFRVDPLGGQKTGFFLDQRELRQRIAALAPGRRILDVFCYTGAATAYAARAGATEAVAIDSSQSALETLAENLQLNELAPIKALQGDAFELLQALGEAKNLFDVILLDPPPFAPARKDRDEALIAHTRLHKLALRLLSPGGHLVSSSCSHHVDDRDLGESAAHAALQSGRSLRLLATVGAYPDHPAVPGMPESSYLQSLVLQA